MPGIVKISKSYSSSFCNNAKEAVYWEACTPWIEETLISSNILNLSFPFAPPPYIAPVAFSKAPSKEPLPTCGNDEVYSALKFPSLSK